MKKLKNNSGLTLVETLVALFILVMMIVGMDTVMDSSMRVYDEATFEADSSIMANIVNTALGDVLRYAEDVDTADGQAFVDASGTNIPNNVQFVFTSYDYGMMSGYFALKNGILEMRDITGEKTTELVNSGVYRAKATMYSDLIISNFRIVYVPPGTAVTHEEVTVTPNQFDVRMDAPEDSAIAGESYTSRGGYFAITYTISDKNDASHFSNESYIVRWMNAPRDAA